MPRIPPGLLVVLELVSVTLMAGGSAILAVAEHARTVPLACSGSGDGAICAAALGITDAAARPLMQAAFWIHLAVG